MTLAINKILNIPGVKVLNCQEFEGIGIIIEIEGDTNSCSCPKCGTLSQSIHQNHWRIVQDLPWSGKTVLLRINRRQFRCKKCFKTFSENLNFVDKQRGYTKRLAIDIVKQVLNSSIRSVAERNDLSEEEVESMLTLQASQINEIDLSLVKRIGIDEIALVKGKGNYLAIIVDLDKNQPIAILQSRRSEELRKLFEEWGSVILFQIEEVSIDLWSPYKNIVMELMPNADVTADRFHVMKQVTDELDTARKLEKKSAEKLDNQQEKKRVLAGLAKSKYSLLKNEESLNEKQKEKLDLVKAVSPNLANMHQLKEDFRNIFETSKSWGDGVIKMLDWIYDAISYFPKSTATIIRWFGETVGYFDLRTTNGVVEGINNKLKLIKRLGYGFRNFENFRLRALLNWHFSINLP